MFELRREEPGRVAMVGRLDAAEADKATADFQNIRESVVLDCAHLDYISSAGIGLLVELYKRLVGGGHTLVLVDLPPRVKNTFHYAGLDQLLDIR